MDGNADLQFFGKRKTHMGYKPLLVMYSSILLLWFLENCKYKKSHPQKSNPMTWAEGEPRFLLRLLGLFLLIPTPGLLILGDRNYLYDHSLWNSVCLEPSKAVVWHVCFFSTLLCISLLQILLVVIHFINSFLGLFCSLCEKWQVMPSHTWVFSSCAASNLSWKRGYELQTNFPLGSHVVIITDSLHIYWMIQCILNQLLQDDILIEEIVKSLLLRGNL